METNKNDFLFANYSLEGIDSFLLSIVVHAVFILVCVHASDHSLSTFSRAASGGTHVLLFRRPSRAQPMCAFIFWCSAIQYRPKRSNATADNPDVERSTPLLHLERIVLDFLICRICILHFETHSLFWRGQCASTYLNPPILPFDSMQAQTKASSAIPMPPLSRRCCPHLECIVFHPLVCR